MKRKQTFVSHSKIFVLRYALLFLIPFFMAFFDAAPPLHAYWLWSPEGGKFVTSEAGDQGQPEELFQQGVRFKAENKVSRAIGEWENLIRRYPTSVVASKAQYEIGVVYEEKHDYEKAVDAYKKLAENYPQSEHFDDVLDRLFRIGNLYLTGEKGKLAGVALVSGLPKAVQVFEHIVKMAPYSEYGDRSQFNIGLAYKKMGKFQFAADAFEKMLNDYPASSLADDARYQLAESSYEYSKRASRDERALDDAVQAITDFLDRYPESNVTEKVVELKKEINERDAEKNFRIGLFYEKENELESAALYYDDVVKRYPDTAYGKLAAEKLNVLREPLENMRKEQRDIVIERDAVRAKLKLLEQERKQILGRADLAASDEKIKQLEAEIKRLRTQEALLKGEQWRAIQRREEALRRDENAWREKWKNFLQKRKDMKDNTAPELARAFERWEASLNEEKARFAKERETIKNLREEFRASWELAESEEEVESERPREEKFKDKKFRKSKFAKKAGGISKKIQEFREADLEDLRSRRDGIFQERLAKEKELTLAMARLVELDHEGFQASSREPWFQALLESKHSDLKERQNALEERRKHLSGLVLEFERNKALYEKTFKNVDKDKWVLPPATKALETTDELMARDVETGELLRELRQDKARVSEAWMMQKEVVETVASAFEKKEEAPEKEEKIEASGEKETSPSPFESELGKLDSRTLKKRAKFLEREIRKRLDEIEDWNEQKEETIAKMESLLQDRAGHPWWGKALHPITAPVKFMFWLTRSLAFGLSDEDRKVVKQSRQVVSHAPEDDGAAAKLRRLQEEIELQSFLIQGRYEEVGKLREELQYVQQVLRSRGIALVPIVVEHEFLVGEESLRSAQRILSDQNRPEVLIDKMDEETRKLQSLQNQLDQLDAKIAKISALEKSLKPSEKKSAPKVDEWEEGPETEPQLKGKTKDEWEALLTTLRERIEVGEAEYEHERKMLENALYDFYLKHLGAVSSEALTEKEKSAHEERKGLSEKCSTLNEAIAELRQSEKTIALEEHAIWEKRIKRYEKELRRMKDNQENPLYVSVGLELESAKQEAENLERLVKTIECEA